MVQEPRLHALDYGAEIDRSTRTLPHWFQPGVATFVTFRAADSMPRAAIERWQEQQRLFLKTHNLSRDLDDASIAKLPDPIRTQFKRFRTSSFNRALDKGHGKCELRRREIQSIVAEKLWWFDRVRYDLDCFVIMPNHVHVIVGIRQGWHLRAECDNWLHYSAVRINKLLNRTGSFWQPEPFDHCLRSAEQLQWTRRYIWRNPIVAHVRPDEYLYWQSSDSTSG